MNRPLRKRHFIIWLFTTVLVLILSIVAYIDKPDFSKKIETTQQP